MSLVRDLVDELRANPDRFRATDGYDRLLTALRRGSSPAGLKEALREGSDVAGDLLWTIAELETVDGFVPEARQYLSDPDKGTAAYAMEIVLRGGRARDDLRAAFDRLDKCHDAVRQHAVRTLTGAGLTRVREVLDAADLDWSRALADRLARPMTREEIESLVRGSGNGRQLVGVVLASLAQERDGTYIDLLVNADEAWIRDHGEFLESLPANRA